VSKQAIQWLYGELPILVTEGVLSADTAERLRQRYGDLDTQPRRALGLLICGVLGAILIGAGIILLFAHNWDQLSRPVRTILAFTPLLGAQLLTGWTILRRAHSAAWRESVSTFLFTAIGATIALVGQTYHIPGDLGDFLLTWILLSLPLIYLLEASLLAVLVWIGSTFWLSYAQRYGSPTLLFWPLVAAGVPHLWRSWREDAASLRTVGLLWVLSLCLSVAVGILSDRFVYHLWVIAYACFFSLLYGLDVYGLGTSDSLWRRPLGAVGASGITLLTVLFTYPQVWKQIHQYADHTDWPFNAWTPLEDYVVTSGLLVLALALIIVLMHRKQGLQVAYSVIAPLATVSYAVTLAGTSGRVAVGLFNAYLILLGVLTLRAGLQQQHLGTVNGGLVLLGIFIITRFFDADWSFTVRGIAFILLGTVFLIANWMFKRRGMVA